MTGTKAIGDMINYLGDAGADAAEFESLVELNSFGVQFRYDSSWQDGVPIDRPALIDAIHGLQARVRSVLSGPPSA